MFGFPNGNPFEDQNEPDIMESEDGYYFGVSDFSINSPTLGYPTDSNQPPLDDSFIFTPFPPAVSQQQLPPAPPLKIDSFHIDPLDDPNNPPILESDQFDVLGDTPPPNSTYNSHHRRSITTPVAKFQYIIDQSNANLPRSHQGRQPPALMKRKHAYKPELVFTPRETKRSFAIPVVTAEDHQFDHMCHDNSITLNPHRLGFIPKSYWPDQNFTFGQIVSDHFQRKNNPNCRFFHKLYNAARLTSELPRLIDMIGVSWITESVLMVNRHGFARLLGIRSVDGSLFHQQGNFPTHGFIELTTHQVRALCGPQYADSFDPEITRYMQHQGGIFVRGCTEDKLAECHWVSAKGPFPCD